MTVWVLYKGIYERETVGVFSSLDGAKAAATGAMWSDDLDNPYSRDPDYDIEMELVDH